MTHFRLDFFGVLEESFHGNLAAAKHSKFTTCFSCILDLKVSVFISCVMYTNNDSTEYFWVSLRSILV